MQIPYAVTIVTDPYPGVPGDDVVLDGEDGAPVVMYPGHLVTPQPHHAAGQNHVSPLRHRHVLSRKYFNNFQPQQEIPWRHQWSQVPGLQVPLGSLRLQFLVKVLIVGRFAIDSPLSLLVLSVLVFNSWKTHYCLWKIITSNWGRNIFIKTFRNFGQKSGRQAG